MTDLQWHDFLKIGVEFIDDDHRKLLQIMQDIKATIEHKNYDKCVALLNTLLSEAKGHFSREEKYLEEVKYPGLKEHKKYHDELLVKADSIKKICQGIETEHDLKQCFDKMAHFLVDDILKGDIKFKSYLEYEGYVAKK